MADHDTELAAAGPKSQEYAAALARLQEQLDATPVGCAVQLSHGTAATIVACARPAGDDTAPPAYLALDVWQALSLPVAEFHGYYERNGWAETWASLMSAIRGPATCGRPVDGETCVLAPHPNSNPCYGASDAGSLEPLPAAAGPRAGDTAPEQGSNQLAEANRIIREAWSALPLRRDRDISTLSDGIHLLVQERDAARSEAAALRHAGSALAAVGRRYAALGRSADCGELLDKVAAWRSAAGSPTTDAQDDEAAPGPEYAIIETNRGGGVEYPIAERNTNGAAGWRVGGELVPDSAVTHVDPVTVIRQAGDSADEEMPAGLAEAVEHLAACAPDGASGLLLLADRGFHGLVHAIDRVTRFAGQDGGA